MNQNDKCELLKKTIEQLYSKEGRSRVYISELLGLNRKILGLKIKEWNLEEPKTSRYIKPSIQKFLNKNKQLIKSRLDNDISVIDISKELKCTRDFLTKQIIEKDEILLKAKNDYLNRIKCNSEESNKKLMEDSFHDYFFEDLTNEDWKPIKGYENYYISNMGRVKSFAKKYNSFYLLKPTKNNKNGYMYISLYKDKKRINYNLARLVGHAFCEGFSDIKNTINHKDGNKDNNTSENLEWLSQSENLKHSYKDLNRQKVKSKPLNYYILYKNVYKFKTITAFAKFLNLSWTQTKRYIEEPEKHDIILIQK